MEIKRKEYAIAIAMYKKDNDKLSCNELDFTIIKNDKKYWAADPFIIEYDNSLYVFAELYDYRKQRGIIGYTKIMNEKNDGWHPIIEETYHLSFPNIFEYDGKLYMCPESGSSKKIVIYECIEFPNVWKKTKELKRGERFVDTIFLNLNNKKIGLSYIPPQKKLDNNTGRTIAFDLKDSNKINVLFENKQAIRPGGKAMNINGKTYVPFQIGIPFYGRGLCIKEANLENSENKLLFTDIKELYPDDFKINTNKKILGIHTINFSQHYCVIDVMWRRIEFKELFYRLLSKIETFRKKYKGIINE